MNLLEHGSYFSLIFSTSIMVAWVPLHIGKYPLKFSMIVLCVFIHTFDLFSKENQLELILYYNHFLTAGNQNSTSVFPLQTMSTKVADLSCIVCIYCWDDYFLLYAFIIWYLYCKKGPRQILRFSVRKSNV